MLKRTVALLSVVIALAMSQNMIVNNGQVRTIPKTMNYQGYLTDATGNPITNPSISMTFAIFDAMSSGNQKWTESQTVAVDKGIFNVMLGSIAPIPDSVFTKGIDRWLQLTVSAQVLSPRTKIIAASYAYTATYSDTAEYARNTVNDNDWIRNGGKVYTLNTTDSIGVRTITPRYALDVSGVICGGLSDTIIGFAGAILGGYNNNAGDNASDTAATVAGGRANAAIGPFSFVGGGAGNVADGRWSVISGGIANTTSDSLTTVSGGRDNVASRYFSTIGGGRLNTASGSFSIVGGGRQNSANDQYSVVAGGFGNSSGVNAAIGGGYGNNATGNNATVAGGYSNDALGNYSSIGGGGTNEANNVYCTIAGGSSCYAVDSYATVGGGYGNRAMGKYSAIVGGMFNKTYGRYSVIGGGYDDTTVSAFGGIFSGYMNTAGVSLGDTANVIAGGRENSTYGDYTYVGGGWSNVCGGVCSAVGGGSSNEAAGWYCTVAGGGGNTANYRYSAIAGGFFNTAAADYTFIGSGYWNSVTDSMAVIGGGELNSVAAKYSVIAGGFADTISATGEYSYLFGINSNLTQDSTFMVDMPHVWFGNETLGYELPRSRGNNGQIMVTNATGQLSWTDPGVGAGSKWSVIDSVLTTNQRWGLNRGSAANMLYGDSAYTHTNFGGYACTTGIGTANNSYMVICGGNRNAADSQYAVIVGGYRNHAYGRYSAIAGGYFNGASGYGSVIGGGQANNANASYATVAGGFSNEAGNYGSAVSGGTRNACSGQYSAICGGYNDTITAAGSYSMAFGNGVYLNNNYYVLLYDSANPGCVHINRDHHDVPANSYPFQVGTSTSNGNGAYLTNGGVWTDGSSKYKKEDFQSLDGAALLQKVAGLDITKWKFINSEERHISPVAQDFYQAFGCGAGNIEDDSTHIAAMDLAGVSLAAIKELNKLVREQREVIDIQQEKIAGLESRLKALENR